TMLAGAEIPEGAEIIDARGWAIGPGLVDLYARTGEPGYERRETLDSLARAALAGGFTQVALLPSTDPVTDTPAQVARIRQHHQVGLTPHCLPLAAVTRGRCGESMTDFAELAEMGAIAFCDDSELLPLELLRRVLDYLAPLQKPLFIWPCHAELAGRGVMQEGARSLQLGLRGVPAMAETAAVAAVLEMLSPHSPPVHFMRLSQARSLELVSQARQSHLSVSASTTWMHLLLCDRDIETYRYHPALHLHSPLGTNSDREALIDAVRAGEIAIATDHSPYAFEEKNVPFAPAPPGAIGLELALPLLWQHLVSTEKLSALALWTALSVHPARILGLEPPQLHAKSGANCILFDPDRTWVVDTNTLHSQSSATPWLGKTLAGKVLGCWLDGGWVPTS
ncbi:MAG: dihydroorotase, partial [Cyanobacteria bacterium J06639_1]